MELEQSGLFLDKIGQILAEDLRHSTEPALVYAQLDTKWISAAVFQSRSNCILYFDPSDDLCYAFLDLWEAQERPRRKRWEEIEYVVRDGKFSATFNYREEIDHDEEPLERRARIVVRHFGDKPVVYPPWPKTAEGPQFEL